MFLKLGSDIEFPVFQENNIIPAANLGLPDKFGDPLKIGEVTSVIWDNVQIETNIIPSGTLQEFINNHNKLLNELDHFLKDKGCVFDIKPEIELDELTLFHPTAMISGCAPELNAYTGNKEKVTLDERKRFCSGHIHISLIPKEYDFFRLVKCLDYYLGIPLMKETPDEIKEQEFRRRKHVGRAGSFRINKIKYYGIEYRVPSSYWVKHDNLKELIFLGVQEAIKQYQNGFDPNGKQVKEIRKVLEG